MIANMIEIHANATPFDGGVYISSCDKGMPANLMGLARVNIPSVVVTGGTMHAGPELLTLEQLGMYSAKYERGEIDEAKLNWAKQNACPSCGACSFIGTASTMQIMLRLWVWPCRAAPCCRPPAPTWWSTPAGPAISRRPRKTGPAPQRHRDDGQLRERYHSPRGHLRLHQRPAPSACYRP